MKIAVVGSGFVGRATGKGLQKHNNDIVFADVVQEKIDQLREEGFEAHLADKYKKITTDITMFCVPTPTKEHAIQLQYLKKAVTEFAERLKEHPKYHVAVIRSTVPPKTTREVVLPIIEEVSGKKVGQDFGLCMQPEYLREVTANEDFERPWFILIGQYDEKSGNVLEKLYRSFDAPIERLSLEEAEMQKYVHNVYNAVKIAFFNEMHVIAKKENWNAEAIFRATAKLRGYLATRCMACATTVLLTDLACQKDTRALLQWGDDNSYELGILRAVIKENLRHESLLGKNETVRINYLENIRV